jgi:hypothetical protein
MAAIIPYSADNIPAEVLKNTLDTYWDERQRREIPKPNFYLPNIEIRVDLHTADACVIRLGTIGVVDTQRGNFVYKDIKIDMSIELLTMASRQRLYDLRQEIERICYTHKHDLTEYQLVRMKSFIENSTDYVNVWAGTISISLESSGILCCYEYSS